MIELEARASEVSIQEEELSVRLADGRTVSVPILWFPRLREATAEQRQNFRLIGGGEGIHWPDIDEDLSVAGMLAGWHGPMAVRSPEQHEFQEPLAICTGGTSAFDTQTPVQSGSRSFAKISTGDTVLTQQHPDVPEVIRFRFRQAGGVSQIAGLGPLAHQLAPSQFSQTWN